MTEQVNINGPYLSIQELLVLTEKQVRKVTSKCKQINKK